MTMNHERIGLWDRGSRKRSLRQKDNGKSQLIEQLAKKLFGSCFIPSSRRLTSRCLEHQRWTEKL
ncbi:MAG: hypothetical protein KME30_33425 [Iphinoe sp. HA4291-MV1]|nr:hypothetical protein [Iphinoe sp. HA4291-MV1]